MTKQNLIDHFFEGAEPTGTWRYWEITDPDIKVIDIGDYCDAENYASYYEGSLVVATQGTVSTGTEITS